MKDFFEDIDGEIKDKLSSVYYEMLEIKKHRGALLEQYRVQDAEELLDKIRKGEVDEHPAYDDYLAVLSINNEIEPLRERCKAVLEGE